MTTDKDLTPFYEGRDALATRRTQVARDKVQNALTDLIKAGDRITVQAVAEAAGVERTSLYAANFTDILTNIKKAMNEEPPPATTRTTERDYQAQILDLHQQLTEARKHIDELISKAGEAELIAAASPTRTDLDDREAENARLRAELIDKTNELHATHKERDELRRDSLGKQDRIDQLIRDNTDLVQERQALERQLKASQRNAPK